MAIEKVKVPKMVKFAMANAKLADPKTSGRIRNIWLDALRTQAEGKKRQAKNDRTARVMEPRTTTETASIAEA